MVSIIIPTLNEEKFLPLILKDLSNQTFQDFEIIVADAGSRDDTVNIAETYKYGVGRIMLSSIFAVIFAPFQSRPRFRAIVNKFYGGWGKW